jgi:hypothetical protein
LASKKVLEAGNAPENRIKYYKEMAELLKKRLQNRSDIDHVRSLAILGMFFKMSFPDIPEKDAKEFIMSIHKLADDGLSLEDILLSSERSIGVAEGMVRGKAMGEAVGEIKGEIKGARKAALEMVTNMLNRKTVPLAEISAISGMKEDEVLALQAELGL